VGFLSRLIENRWVGFSAREVVGISTSKKAEEAVIIPITPFAELLFTFNRSGTRISFQKSLA
jgi:hypothetical protein